MLLRHTRTPWLPMTTTVPLRCRRGYVLLPVATEYVYMLTDWVDVLTTR